MSAPVKILQLEAFSPLATELSTFGAMYHAEANARFGTDFVDSAMARKICAEVMTDYGSVLVLAHRGRILAGLTGFFIPKPENAANSVCLRDAYLDIIAGGGTVDLVSRKRRGALVYTQGSEKIMVLAQAKGFNRGVIRRTYKNDIESGEYSQLHLYSYLSRGEVEEFGVLMLHSKQETALPIDPERFLLFSIKPWPEAHQG